MSRKIGVKGIDLASSLDSEIDRQAEVTILAAQPLAEIALAKIGEIYAHDAKNGVPKRLVVATENLYRDIAGKLER